MAIRKFDDEKVVDWSNQAPAEIRIMTLTVSSQYNRGGDGKIQNRNVRCSLRGYLMKSGVHYYPDRVKCPTAEKATARLLFAIAAGHAWKIEHMDITIAYAHEPSSSPKPIFVRELPDWQGNFKHGRRTGLLVRNLWGGRYAGHNYADSLF